MSNLVHVDVPSIYPQPHGGPMPDHLALARPNVKDGIGTLAVRLQQRGRRLVLSDLFRPYEVQRRAYLEYTASKAAHPDDPSKWKPRRSPPGEGPHEGGIALDFSLDDALSRDYTLEAMWADLAELGWSPIIEKPDPHQNEAWHIEYRGPFAPLHDLLGYKTMVRAAIADIGGTLSLNDDLNAKAHVQYQLLRLGSLKTTKIDGGLTIIESGALTVCCNDNGIPMEAPYSLDGIATLLSAVRPDSYDFAPTAT